MLAPISADVATDMGLPRHSVRNVGTDVAKFRFLGFTNMAGGLWSVGHLIPHAAKNVVSMW
eukprot:11386440-Karenia_brevis.AAC.1